VLLDPYLGRAWNHILAGSSRSPARNYPSKSPPDRPLELYLGRKCRIGSIKWPRVQAGPKGGSPRTAKRASRAMSVRNSHPLRGVMQTPGQGPPSLASHGGGSRINSWAAQCPMSVHQTRRV